MDSSSSANINDLNDGTSNELCVIKGVIETKFSHGAGQVSNFFHLARLYTN